MDGSRSDGGIQKDRAAPMMALPGFFLRMGDTHMRGRGMF
tara:strand:- start:2324 stop:2443 length:120 start_codon:yes stop_codon:yes gene_type:complete